MEAWGREGERMEPRGERIIEEREEAEMCRRFRRDRWLNTGLDSCAVKQVEAL